jgi:WD40 repeat protein
MAVSFFVSRVVISGLVSKPSRRDVGRARLADYWRVLIVSLLSCAYRRVRLISPAHDGEALCVCISHSGALIASGGTDDMVKLWDMASGELLAEGSAHSGHVHSLSFSPDDRQLVSVGEDGNAMVWNIYTD